MNLKLQAFVNFSCLLFPPCPSPGPTTGRRACPAHAAAAPGARHAPRDTARPRPSLPGCPGARRPRPDWPAGGGTAGPHPSPAARQGLRRRRPWAGAPHLFDVGLGRGVKILLAHEVGERLPHGGGGEGATGSPHWHGRPAGSLRRAFRVGGRAFLPAAAASPLSPAPPPPPPRAPRSARRHQDVPPAAALLLRHLRGAATRRGGGPRRLREELGPAGGRGAGGRLLPGRRAPARRRAGGEGTGAAPPRGATSPSGDGKARAPFNLLSACF